MNRIALLGQPNSGKSTVFNGLTGARQHVGNWPGKTVEKKDGSYLYQGDKYEVFDLPGSYGLSGNSDEEIITEEFIRSGKADLTIILVDTSQLERSLYMLAEFSEINKPSLLLLNMMDVAESQGKHVDAKKLEEKLGIPVLGFVAADISKYDLLKEKINDALNNPKTLKTLPKDNSNSNDKYAWIEEILEGVTTKNNDKYVLSKLDQLMMRPILGKVVCIGVILLAFLVAMIVMMPAMAVGSMIPGLIGPPIRNALEAINVHPWLVSIFGLMLPNVLYFSVAMAGFVFGVHLVFGYLEEIGFIARAAYQFDTLLSKLGLQGKAIAPILMGFGCTIGGATGTRVMDNWGQRMLAMVIVWAVPCASIWAIMPVISNMFFPWWGTLLVCLGILVYVFILMVIVSKVFGNKLSPVASRSGMIMELPPYHKAHFKHILKEALYQAWDIFLRALRVVTLISMLFWVLSYSSSGKVENSLLYKVGVFIEPVTRIFGLGWRTFAAFLASGFAKEAVLGVLNAIFVGQSSLLDATFNSKVIAVDGSQLAGVMGQAISQAEALAFIFACTFNVPCVMALSTTYRESHSLKWTFIVAIFFMTAALILSAIVYHVANLFL